MTGRIVIIPFLQGKLAPDGTLIEPDIDAILEKWLERHPEFRGRKFHVIKTGGDETCLVRVTTDESPRPRPLRSSRRCRSVRGVSRQERGLASEVREESGSNSARRQDGSRTSSAREKALSYLIGEKFLNFLEAAEEDRRFRAEIPALRGRDQDDLRAVATGRVPGNARADRTVRSTPCRAEERPPVAGRAVELEPEDSKWCGRTTFAMHP